MATLTRSTWWELRSFPRVLRWAAPLAGLIGFDGWAAGVIWLGSLVVGFGIARQVNARLFGPSPH